MVIEIEKNPILKKSHPVSITTPDNKEYYIIRHDNKCWILRHYPNLCTDALYYPYKDIALLPELTPVFDSVVRACQFVLNYHEYMI